MSLLGIDIGTSGCKAVAYSETGVLLTGAYRSYSPRRDNPGESELDVRVVEDAVFSVIRETALAVAVSDPVTAVAAASLGEAVVIIHKNGGLAAAYSVLPEDNRSAQAAKEFAARFPEEEVRKRTGVVPAPFYTLPLLARLYKEEPLLAEKTGHILPWADFIAYRLSGIPHCSYTLASRTLAFDVNTNSWIHEYITGCGLDPEWFPQPVAPGTCLGTIRPETAEQLGLSANVKIVAGTHDQCAAAAGSGAASPEEVMLGLGTYACAVFCFPENAKTPSAYGAALNRTPHVLPGHYAGYLFHGGCGSLNNWLCRNCFADLTGSDVYTAMFREIRDWKKRSVPLVLPDFGQGCGAISNLSFGHTRADLLLGAWQGGLFFFRETMTQLKAERGLKRIIISGGSSRYPEILQLTADILSLPVIKNKAEEVGTLGCAMLAGSGSGVYSSIGSVIRELPEQLSCYEPQDDYSSEHQKWMQFFNANRHQ